MPCQAPVITWHNGAMRIAMVCHGNICRSPMAEAVARALLAKAGLGDEVVVESFGTSREHAGEGIDPRAAAALARRGWSMSGHHARQLRAADVALTDLVLCADRANLRDVLRLGVGDAEVRLLRSYDPDAAAGDQEVPDPWFGSDADFDRALDLIERACHGLVGQLTAVVR